MERGRENKRDESMTMSLILLCKYSTNFPYNISVSLNIPTIVLNLCAKFQKCVTLRQIVFQIRKLRIRQGRCISLREEICIRQERCVSDKKDVYHTRKMCIIQERYVSDKKDVYQTRKLHIRQEIYMCIIQELCMSDKKVACQTGKPYMQPNIIILSPSCSSALTQRL